VFTLGASIASRFALQLCERRRTFFGLFSIERRGPEVTVVPLQPSCVDWRRIEGWTAEIVSGPLRSLRQTFGADRVGPTILWRPPVPRLAAPQLRFLMEYWGHLAGGRPMPQARDIDAVEMRPALGHVNLLDVIEQGRDFRYRVFGSAIAAVTGFDMTGRRASALRARTEVVEFALAIYRAVVERGEPLLTEHGPPSTVSSIAWHSLILPLADASGGVARLLAGAVPVARDGRALLPRL
jgi:hypothetical protein